MKKILLVLAVTALITNLCIAAGKNLEAGVYDCSFARDGVKAVCKIYVDKFGVKIFEGDCNNYEKSTNESINARCKKISADNSMYYTCEYADTTCRVVFFEDYKSYHVSCDGNENIPEDKLHVIYERVKRDAIIGSCTALQNK